MKLRALLRLFRIPNVFTAFANVVAGVGIARGGQFMLRDTALVLAAMGTCRALNVGLGLSVAPATLPVWALWLPLAVGIFTLLITRLSRFEVGGTSPERLRSTVWGFAGLGAALLPGLVWIAFRNHASWLAVSASALLLGFLWTRGFRLLAPLLHEVSPARLGQAIGGGILLMPALDAAFVAASGSPLIAAVVFGLTAPAYLLKRWYYLT